MPVVALEPNAALQTNVVHIDLHAVRSVGLGGKPDPVHVRPVVSPGAVALELGLRDAELRPHVRAGGQPDLAAFLTHSCGFCRIEEVVPRVPAARLCILLEQFLVNDCGCALYTAFYVTRGELVRVRVGALAYAIH